MNLTLFGIDADFFCSGIVFVTDSFCSEIASGTDSRCSDIVFVKDFFYSVVVL